MNNNQFYRQCYEHTGGWLPMWPLTQEIKLGDFCQYRHGVLLPLGNIKGLRVLNEVLLSPPMLLNQQQWLLDHGVESILLNQRDNWVEQILAFAQPGSFLFHLQEPKAQYILNWQAIKDNLTIKLTQTEFSFRDIMVITAVSSGSDWAGAIAGNAQAELKLTAEFSADSNDCHHVLQQLNASAELTRHIDYYEKQIEKPCYFFQAKKLVLTDMKKEQLLTELAKRNNELAPEYAANRINVCSVDQFPAQGITINNCLDYFTWKDFTCEDIEPLCQN